MDKNHLGLYGQTIDPSHCIKAKLLQDNSKSSRKLTEKEDLVNNPSHYTNGDIETIDYIKDKLSAEEFTGYCIGNVLKYVSRYRLKGGKIDLEKASKYLEWAIENYEG